MPKKKSIKYRTFRKTISRSLNGFSDRLLRIHLKKFLLSLAVLLVAIPAHGHYGGRIVPIGYTGEGSVHLAAQVIASYFEEQMGREMELSVESTVEECFQTINRKKAPMAVVPLGNDDVVPGGIVGITPALKAGKVAITLVMGADARKNLQYSLVPKYMENLNQLIEPEAWLRALDRVKNGEGVRKVALDMLREADLI